jgi:hypothetical protein
MSTGKGTMAMDKISFWFKWVLILLVLSIIAFVEGFYIGGSLGREWLIATHIAMVMLAVLVMQKYGIICRTESIAEAVRQFRFREEANL